MAWEIEYTDEFEAWWGTLSVGDERSVAEAVEYLEEHGPALGRPFVDTIHGSRHANMKELRPRRVNIRILFAFNPLRTAILLIGGDKTDRWQNWYDRMIPVADDLYDTHLRESPRIAGGRSTLMAGHKKFRDLVRRLDADPVRRAEIDAAKRAMDDIVALAALRERRGATQTAVAGVLGTSQANISKLESRIDHDRDVYLSTLSHYVEALGGRLEVNAVFPDETVQLILTKDRTAAHS